MGNRKKFLSYTLGAVMVAIFSISVVISNSNFKSVKTNADITDNNVENLSNKKIGWGIKRNDNHEQPDLGSKNKEILDKYDGISMGNKDSKNVYLSFDEGYEAGYTEKILDVLKENNVKATFFITAHYVNTQPELVQRMIDEGHIIGNHTPIFLMFGNYKTIKC